MAKSKIQSGDNIKIISGGFKGTAGQVLKIVKKGNGKFEKIRASISTVPGITKYKRSFKYQGQDYPGSMYTVPRLIDLSNLTLLTEKGEISKVIVKEVEGKRVRTLKKTGEVVTKTKLAKIKPQAQEENN
jgi:large subunit ribosomal protein L24